MSFSIEVLQEELTDVKGDVLLVCFFNEELKGGRFEEVDALVGGALSAMVSNKDFVGKKNQVSVLPSLKPTKVKRVCVIGLGDRKNITSGIYFDAMSRACIVSQRHKAVSYVVFSDVKLEKKLKSHHYAGLTTKALAMSTYHFDKYVTNKEAKLVDPVSLVFVGVDDKKQVAAGASRALSIASSANWSRDLGNHPAGDMTPKSLAEDVKRMCKGTAVKVRVLDEEKMKSLGMGAILGVSQGSVEEAQMVIMEYKGGKKDDAPIIFCGKGITFDSGGISIKPSSKMDEMKFDMLGAAAVAGGVHAIAKLGLKVNVVGVLACAENMPGSSALRPGDILTARNKKTIEVLNTDAEGRLVLADALSYVGRYKPKYVVDFATLTGACIVALGMHYAGFFTQDKNVKKVMEKATLNSGDLVWQLPLGEEYTAHIKSKVADVKNIGRRGQAGASSAAAFLQEFTDYPWGHVDMANAWSMADGPTLHCGASGFGVHLIVSLATLETL